MIVRRRTSRNQSLTNLVSTRREDQASTEEARQAMADMEIEPTEPADSPRDVAMIEVNLPGPGEENPDASKPGDPRSSQETRQSANPNAASSTEPGGNRGSKVEVKFEPPGAEPAAPGFGARWLQNRLCSAACIR